MHIPRIQRVDRPHGGAQAYHLTIQQLHQTTIIRFQITGNHAIDPQGRQPPDQTTHERALADSRQPHHEHAGLVDDLRLIPADRITTHARTRPQQSADRHALHRKAQIRAERPETATHLTGGTEKLIHRRESRSIAAAPAQVAAPTRPLRLHRIAGRQTRKTLHRVLQPQVRRITVTRLACPGESKNRLASRRRVLHRA